MLLEAMNAAPPVFALAVEDGAQVQPPTPKFPAEALLLRWVKGSANAHVAPRQAATSVIPSMTLRMTTPDVRSFQPNYITRSTKMHHGCQTAPFGAGLECAQVGSADEVQHAKLPLGLAQFKDHVHRGILISAGCVSVIELYHLEPPRSDRW